MMDYHTSGPCASTSCCAVAAGYSLAAGRMRDPATEPSPDLEDLDDDRCIAGGATVLAGQHTNQTAESGPCTETSRQTAVIDGKTVFRIRSRLLMCVSHWWGTKNDFSTWALHALHAHGIHALIVTHTKVNSWLRCRPAVQKSALDANVHSLVSMRRSSTVPCCAPCWP